MKRPARITSRLGRKSLGAWFADLDRFADVPFMEDGRRQPPMPEPPEPKDPFCRP